MLLASVALAASFLPDVLPDGFQAWGQVEKFGISPRGYMVEAADGDGATAIGQSVVKRVQAPVRFKGDRTKGGLPVGTNPFGGNYTPPPEDPGDPGQADYWLRVDVSLLTPKGDALFKMANWGQAPQNVFAMEAEGFTGEELVYDATYDAYAPNWDVVPVRANTEERFGMVARVGSKVLWINSMLSEGGSSNYSDLPKIERSYPGNRTYLTIDSGGARPLIRNGAYAMLRAMKAHLPDVPDGGVIATGDPGTWQTAVGTGAAGAATVAAAAKILATMVRNRPKTKNRKDDEDEEEEDEDEVIGHVLQIGTQHVTLHPGEAAMIEVKVHEVTRKGSYRAARKSKVRLSAPGWSGALQIDPAEGGATMNAEVTLVDKAPAETGQLLVEASTPLGNHSAVIQLTAAPEPTLEGDPEHIELPAGKGGNESFTVWVENAGESEWTFDARFEDEDAPLSLRIEDTDKPFAKYVKITDAVKSGSPRPTNGRDAHKLIVTASGPALREDQEPLERHLTVILIWEGLFLLSVGRSNDQRWHVKADGTKGDAELDVYGLAFDASGKLEDDPARLGLDQLQFGPEEDTSQRNKNLADAAQLEFTFVKFRPSNVPSAVWRIHATKILPGGGGSINLPLLAQQPDRDPDPFSVIVPLSLDTADTEPLSDAWQTELERCRKIVNEFIPPGYRTQFIQLIEQRKMLLGAEGLFELRKKIWRIAYELILAEGAEGYKNEALWADRVVVLLEYTQWGADMAFGAVSGAVLGPYAPFAQFAKAQITAVLVAQAEGTTPEGWLEAIWGQVKSTVEGKIIDIDTLSKLGTKNKAVLWSIYCAYYFFKGIFYEKKSITDAALDTLREVRDELLADFFGSRVKAVSGGGGDAAKPTEPGKTKGEDPAKTKPTDPDKTKGEDPAKTKPTDPDKTKGEDSDKTKPTDP
ncbi:MAG: hypothetical protein KDK99_13130, partial [Verrucomicrobiales bacterium]|nr:hypothetical protein [Verrucomicrobiales bacterium]